MPFLTQVFINASHKFYTKEELPYLHVDTLNKHTHTGTGTHANTSIYTHICTHKHVNTTKKCNHTQVYTDRQTLAHMYTHITICTGIHVHSKAHTHSTSNRCICKNQNHLCLEKKLQGSNSTNAPTVLVRGKINTLRGPKKVV